MNREKLILLCAILATLFASSAFTEVYKCRQPSGLYSYQDSVCKGGAREHRYFRRETQPINLPAIYKSSYNTSSDFNGLSPAKVANSRCLKLCYKHAMACGLQCADQYQNMSRAQPCFNQCRRGTGTCVELCTY